MALESRPGGQDLQASPLLSLLGPTSPSHPSASTCGACHLCTQFSLLISEPPVPCLCLPLVSCPCCPCRPQRPSPPRFPALWKPSPRPEDSFSEQCQPLTEAGRGLPVAWPGCMLGTSRGEQGDPAGRGGGALRPWAPDTGGAGLLWALRKQRSSQWPHGPVADGGVFQGRSAGRPSSPHPWPAQGSALRKCPPTERSQPPRGPQGLGRDR